MWCLSSRRHHHIPKSGIRITTDDVMPSVYIRNGGIHDDADVSTRTRVMKTVSSCFAVRSTSFSPYSSFCLKTSHAITRCRARNNPLRLWKCRHSLDSLDSLAKLQ